MMPLHKYDVGQIATFRNENRTRVAAPGRYRIVAQRPMIDGEPCYVVRSELEQHDRVVAESDLQ